jgi:hypothetical protein
MESPTLSAAGDVNVPLAHETTYRFSDTEYKLQYSCLRVLIFDDKPAIRFLAKGGPQGMGLLTFGSMIPPGTSTLDALKGLTIGAWPNGVSFGNAPDMATGMSRSIKIEEISKRFVTLALLTSCCKCTRKHASRSANSRCCRPDFRLVVLFCFVAELCFAPANRNDVFAFLIRRATLPSTALYLYATTPAFWIAPETPGLP